MKKYLALLMVLVFVTFASASVKAQEDEEPPPKGCSQEALDSYIGTDLEGKMDEVCSGSAFEQVPDARNFQDRVDQNVAEMQEIYDETIERAKNFRPEDPDISDLIAKVQAKRPVIETNDPPAGYVPPAYDPDRPCTWPLEEREKFESESSCENYEIGTQARAMCDAMLLQDVDCSGYGDPAPLPPSCASVGMYDVEGICYCDNPNTADVEPCPAWSACAEQGKYLAPDNTCVDDCNEIGLAFGPGMTCVEDTNCGAGYWVGDEARTCECYVNASMDNNFCTCNAGYYLDTQWKRCVSEDDKYIGNPGDICTDDMLNPPPYDGGDWRDGQCDNPRTKMREMCP